MSDRLFLFSITLGSLVVIVGGCLAATLVGKVECNKLQQMSGKNTDYSLIGGCYVEVNGSFIPRDNWRGEYEK